MAQDSRALPRTSEAIAAHELRKAIVAGELAPGAKIRQEATAAELGVSLIPLREALKTLTGEGVVTYLPQRGYFVTELPGSAIQEIYEVRALLEAECERNAVPRMGERDTQRMREQLRVQELAVEARDAVAMIEGNRGFHFAMFDRCENPWLVRFVTHLWDTVDPYRVLSYRRMWLRDDERMVPAEILAEHDRIVSAIESGRHQRALGLLEKHRERSEAFLRILVDPLAADERGTGS
jgi:DNA-binding GntR family transcriptional regulator